MKKLRVFQTVKKRRIVPGFSPKNLSTVLLLLLMIPYFITFLFGNLGEEEIKGSSALSEEGSIYVRNITALGSECVPLEIYVADRLARSINNDFEMETLKAQAVLIRSGLMTMSKKNQGETEIRVEDTEYGSITISQRIWQAVEETKGVCILWKKRPVNGAYFAVSNGATRNGDEVSTAEYSYLKSVICSRDFLSEDYISKVSCREDEFEKIWERLPGLDIANDEILKEYISETEIMDVKVYRDSVGYVLYVERGGKFVSGERFREAYLLSSSSFHMEKEKKHIVFTVKGEGHGFGMSQFGANELAKEGEDYIDILNYFFQDVTITKNE